MNIKKKLPKFTVIIVVAIICIIALLIGLFSLLFKLPRLTFDATLKNAAAETQNIPAVVVYGTLYVDNDEFDISGFCRKWNKNCSFREVLCVIDKKAFFVCSETDSSTRNWILASIDLQSMNIEEIMCFRDASMPYEVKRNIQYKEQNGYYKDGKIVLNDYKKVMLYDIYAASVIQYKYDEYAFPEMHLEGEVIDSQTILLYLEQGNQVFSIEDMAHSSNGIKQILQLQNKRTWSGLNCLSGFFSENSIQSLGDSVYCIGECLNFAGEAYAVLLEYNQPKNTWQYVTRVYSGDTVHRSSYLVTNIG